MKPRAIFRADASPAIGGGHVMRCLTLADALADRGWYCAFACGLGAAETVPGLVASRHEKRDLALDEAADPMTLRRYWPSGADLLIVDHYGLGAEYEASSRPWATQVLVIDDLANRAHDADVVIDQTFGRSDADYRSRVPPACRLMLGTDYTLLRPEFARARNQALRRREGRSVLKRVLVSMGATDPDNNTGRVLDAIRSSGLDLTVDVILGAAAPHREAVSAQLRTLLIPWVLHVNPSVAAMIDMMIAADLAIGAAGISTWERCCLGLPSFVLVLAENQRGNGSALQRAGAAIVFFDCPGETLAKVKKALREIAIGEQTLAEMSRRAAMLCDGEGGRRVATALDRVVTRSLNEVR